MPPYLLSIILCTIYDNYNEITHTYLAIITPTSFDARIVTDKEGL